MSLESLPTSLGFVFWLFSVGVVLRAGSRFFDSCLADLEEIIAFLSVHVQKKKP